FIRDQWTQQSKRIREPISPRSDNTGRVSARSRFVRAAKSGEQFWRDDFVALIHAERFHERVLGQSGPRAPFLQCRRDWFGWTVRQHALREIACPAIRR